jgi:hypothetical protein
MVQTANKVDKVLVFDNALLDRISEDAAKPKPQDKNPIPAIL